MTKNKYIGNNITTPDFTWKTIPNDKQKLKTRIDASVSNINRQPVEILTDSDSSSDSLPDNVLANYTSENEISSDNDIDLRKESSKGMLDESMEVGSVKSEPMSDEDERGKNKSHNTTGKKSRKNSVSNKEHQKSPAHHKKLKPKIQPCTTEEYNMFLQKERSMNNTSLNIGEDENDVTYNDKNESGIKSSLEESYSEKRKKKKKKKSESHDESEQLRKKKKGKKINGDSINNYNEDSEDGVFEKTSPRMSKTNSVPSTEKKIKNKNNDSKLSIEKSHRSIEKNDYEIKLQSESTIEKKSKKKKKVSESLDELEENTNNRSSNKINRHSLFANDEGSKDNTIIDRTPVIQSKSNYNSNTSTEKKAKKKKKPSELLDESEINDEIEISQRETSTEKIIKKKRKSSDEPTQYKKKSSPLKPVKDSTTDDSDDTEEEADMMTKKRKFDDHQAKLLQLNNLYTNSSESDDALDTGNKAFNKMPSNTLRLSKNEQSPKKNMARSQNITLNKSENESSDENPQYSFQFNSSYDNNKNRGHVNNGQISPVLHTTKSGHDKKVSLKTPADSGTKKSSLKQSNSLKHIANSTALDMTNFELELPNMSIPNVSVIKDIKSSAKKSMQFSVEYKIEDTLAEDYIAKNDNLQYKKFSSTLFDDIGEDDEVFLVQCPKNIDPNLLIDQNIFDSSFHYDDSDYKFTTVKHCAENVSFLFPEKTNTVVKTMPLMGHIIIETDLKPTVPRKVKKSKHKEVEFPDDLQIRHPIFGRNYEKKINIPEHVLTEMVTKKSKKHKKNKRSKSFSRAENEDFNESTTNNQYIHSETDQNEHIPKKKKKKKSINQEKDHLWNSNDDIARNLFVDS